MSEIVKYNDSSKDEQEEKDSSSESTAPPIHNPSAFLARPIQNVTSLSRGGACLRCLASCIACVTLLGVGVVSGMFFYWEFS